MQPNLSEELRKTLIRWMVCFVLVGGFMLYHSTAPLSTIVLAGAGTLVLMGILTYLKVSRG